MVQNMPNDSAFGYFCVAWYVISLALFCFHLFYVVFVFKNRPDIKTSAHRFFRDMGILEFDNVDEITTKVEEDKNNE